MTLENLQELFLEDDFLPGVADELRREWTPVAIMRDRLHGSNGHGLEHEMIRERAKLLEATAKYEDASINLDLTASKRAALRRELGVDDLQKNVEVLERLVTKMPPMLVEAQRQFDVLKRRHAEAAFEPRVIRPMGKVVAMLINRPLKDWERVLTPAVPEVQALATRAQRLVHACGRSAGPDLWKHSVPLSLEPARLTAEAIREFVLSSLCWKPFVLGKNGGGQS